jgi:hypothetical protein
MRLIDSRSHAAKHVHVRMCAVRMCVFWHYVSWVCACIPVVVCPLWSPDGGKKMWVYYAYLHALSHGNSYRFITCVCIGTYTHACIYMHAYIHMHLYIHIYVHVHANFWADVALWCRHISVCIRCKCVCIWIWYAHCSIYLIVYAYMHIHTQCHLVGHTEGTQCHLVGHTEGTQCHLVGHTVSFGRAHSVIW